MYQCLAISIWRQSVSWAHHAQTIERAAPIFLPDADIMCIMNAAETNDIERGRLAEVRGPIPESKRSAAK